MKSRSMILSISLTGIVSLCPLATAAHPMLKRSSPTAGATAKAPDEVALWFSEKIEPVFNRIDVVDAAGTHFEDGKAAVDAFDKACLRVRVKQLAAGSYSVRWRVSAADSHKMEGSFRFQVAP